MSSEDKLREKLVPGAFPTEKFPKELRELIAYYRENFGIPDAATAMTMLTMLSAAIGPLVEVADGSEHGATAPNIWTVLVAPRGSGKSRLAKALAKPLFAAGARVATLEQQWKASIDARLKLLRSECQPKKNYDPGNSDLVTDNQRRIQNLENIHAIKPLIGTATGESLKRTVANAPDHFTFSCCTEGHEQFSIMFGKYGEQKEPDLSCWLALKSGDYLGDQRICRESVAVERGLLAMFLCLQPRVARKLLSGVDTLDRGFFTRMYLFDPGMKTQKAQRRKPSLPPNAFYNELLTHYLEKRIELSTPDLTGGEDVEEVMRRFREAVESIPCDDAARNAFADFHDEGHELECALTEFFPDLSGECSRWREDAIAVAGLLSRFALLESITRELALLACAIVRWCKKSFLTMLLRYNPVEIDDLLQRVIDLIDDSEKGYVSTRHLRKNNGISEQMLRGIILANPGVIVLKEARTSSKQGRHSKIVRFAEREKQGSSQG
jgi:hypothetical protein